MLVKSAGCGIRDVWPILHESSGHGTARCRRQEWSCCVDQAKQNRIYTALPESGLEVALELNDGLGT
jgi:hypothetical protein